MRKNNILNKTWSSLLELITYLGVFSVAIALLFIIVNAIINGNSNTNTSVQSMSNVMSTTQFLDKSLEWMNRILMIKHTPSMLYEPDFKYNPMDVNIFSRDYNQYTWTIDHVKDVCWFVVDEKYDLVWVTSPNTFDPIFIGVIERSTPTGRKYRQLAVYKYRSKKDSEAIRGDILAGKLWSYQDSKGRYKTEWLTPWKCDEKNGFLTPISSKWYTDNLSTNEYDVRLAEFKVSSPDLARSDAMEDQVRYWGGLLDINMIWYKQNKEQVRTLYQNFTKVFTN